MFCFVSSGESVAMHAHAGGGGEFDENVVVIEFD